MPKYSCLDRLFFVKISIVVAIKSS